MEAQVIDISSGRATLTTTYKKAPCYTRYSSYMIDRASHLLNVTWDGSSYEIVDGLYEAMCFVMNDLPFEFSANEDGFDYEYGSIRGYQSLGTCVEITDSESVTVRVDVTDIDFEGEDGCTIIRECLFCMDSIQCVKSIGDERWSFDFDFVVKG